MDKKNHSITTSEIRDTLKICIQKEIINLPSLLAKLSEAQRVNAILKLMPFVFPKVNSVRLPQEEESE